MADKGRGRISLNGAGKIRCLITSSNTGEGFRTFIPDLLEDVDRVFIIKGVPGSGKATLIRDLGEKAAESGLDIEYWISALDPQSPEGLYIPALGTAVVNGSLLPGSPASYPAAPGYVLNLDRFLTDWPAEEGEEVKELFKEIEQKQAAAQKYLQEAQGLKRQMAELSCSGIKGRQYTRLVKEITARILQRSGGEKHYFAAALTPEGLISYIDQLSEEYPQRYLFKGCVLIQSSIIGEIAREIKKSGYGVEFYHSGLEPGRILMVMVRELQLVLLAADEVRIRQRPGDVVINLRDWLGEEQRQEEGEDLYALYESYTELLNKTAREMKSLLQKLNEIGKRYAPRMDFAGLEQLKNEIMKEIFTISQKRA